MTKKKEATIMSSQFTQVHDHYINLAHGFIGMQPLYFDRSALWWSWNDNTKKWERVDETDVMNALRSTLPLNQFSTVSDKHNLLEALRQVARVLAPEEPPKNWIQFDKEYYDLETAQRTEATPEWFGTNPIPWSIGESEETPIIDQLFSEWVGKEWRTTLYEILAYACYRGYPLHIAICLIGIGANGKSKFQELLRKFIGEDNVCSTDLELLTKNRFETAKLYKQLVAIMGETNFNLLERTKAIKELTGEDLIRYEEKFKAPWSGFNYAKLMLNTNSLPMTDDNTIGWFRRWLIIDFPNQFQSGENPIDKVSPQEYHNLAKKITRLLPELLERGTFTNQGDYKEQQLHYQEASNPFPIYKKKHYHDNADGFVSYGTVFTDYNGWLKKKNRRQVSHKEFSKILVEECLERKRTTKQIAEEYIADNWILGIEKKNAFEVFDHD